MAEQVDTLATLADRSTGYPRLLGLREARFAELVKTYVDALDPSTIITTEGDLIVGDSGGSAIRLPKGTSGLPLVAGASTSAYTALSATGLASDAVTTAKILDANVTAAKLASDSVLTAKILNANVTLAKLSATLAPAAIVKFDGEQTSTNSATMTFSVPGALTSDRVHVQLKTAGGTPRTITTARVSAADTIEIVWSGAPSTDHVLAYQVLRTPT